MLRSASEASTFSDTDTCSDLTARNRLTVAPRDIRSLRDRTDAARLRVMYVAERGSPGCRATAG
jgi:hypothetical protein